MSCYNPLSGYNAGLNPSGKTAIVFDIKQSIRGEEIKLPCGNCIGCRLDKARNWAIRCMHEAQLHSENCFITLTYDEDHVPKNGSLDKREFQLFMKRLRKRFGDGIRFFHCGEYGENLGRPHYHALLFGLDFADKELWVSRNGVPSYKSKILDDLWGNGFTEVGDLTEASASYVARYALKKVTGDQSDDHYQGREPEYVTMSRRPGIGAEYYRLYRNDFFPVDFVVVNGKKDGVPPYYDKLLEKDDLEMFGVVKKKEC